LLVATFGYDKARRPLVRAQSTRNITTNACIVILLSSTLMPAWTASLNFVLRRSKSASSDEVASAKQCMHWVHPREIQLEEMIQDGRVRSHRCPSQGRQVNPSNIMIRCLQ
jgi:hypothetical protein